MCWDRIIDAEAPDRKRVQAPEPSKRKAEQPPTVSRPASSPLTQDIPELVETRFDSLRSLTAALSEVEGAR